MSIHPLPVLYCSIVPSPIKSGPSQDPPCPSILYSKIISPPAGTGIGMVVALRGTCDPLGNHRKSPAGTDPPPAQDIVGLADPDVQFDVVVPPVDILLHNAPIPLLKLSS